MWNIEGSLYSSDNFIPDTSTSFHVTSIVLGLTIDSAIFSVKIEGDGAPRDAYPTTQGCSDPIETTRTLTVGVN